MSIHLRTVSLVLMLAVMATGKHCTRVCRVYFALGGPPWTALPSHSSLLLDILQKGRLLPFGAVETVSVRFVSLSQRNAGGNGGAERPWDVHIGWDVLLSVLGRLTEDSIIASL